MNFSGLFGAFAHEKPGPSADINDGPYAALERKIDLVLYALHIDVASLDAEMGLPGEIRRLIAQGRKIEAIKHYRERTRVGLAEAKDAIDTGRTVNPLLLLEMKLDLALKALNVEDTVPAASSSPSATPSAGRDSEVERLIQQGQMIHAIKVYREQTGLGLRESKEAVDALAARIRSGR